MRIYFLDLENAFRFFEFNLFFSDPDKQKIDIRNWGDIVKARIYAEVSGQKLNKNRSEKFRFSKAFIDKRFFLV